MITCKAVTKDAPQAYTPRKSHRCKFAPWLDGFCRIHHPALRMTRLALKRARLARALAKVDAEIAEVRAAGVAPGDLPGQAVLFEEERVIA